MAIGVSVPEVVPDWTVNLAKCWSEWQDLNLRPPRPEWVSLRESSTFTGVFDDVQSAPFTFRYVISVG